MKGKTTLIDHRIAKPANMSGPQQELVPGSGKVSGAPGKMTNGRGRNELMPGSSMGQGHFSKMGNGRGKNL